MNVRRRQSDSRFVCPPACTSCSDEYIKGSRGCTDAYNPLLPASLYIPAFFMVSISRVSKGDLQMSVSGFRPLFYPLYSRRNRHHYPNLHRERYHFFYPGHHRGEFFLGMYLSAVLVLTKSAGFRICLGLGREDCMPPIPFQTGGDRGTQRRGSSERGKSEIMNTSQFVSFSLRDFISYFLTSDDA